MVKQVVVQMAELMVEMNSELQLAQAFYLLALQVAVAEIMEQDFVVLQSQFVAE